MITNQQFEQLAHEVIAKQGYIIIGQPASAHRFFDIGEKIRKIMQFEFDEEFEVFAKARQKDWNAQNDLIAGLRPNWRRFPNQIGAIFFKVKKV
jgi:hypothetical protein